MERTLSRICLLLTLTACGPSSDAADAEALSTSADVVQRIDRDRILPLEEELRVDGSREDVSLYLVRAAALDDAGTMYVLDSGNNHVLVLDSAGGFVRTFGRAGQGPGEFQRARTMWVKGDTVAVTDSGNRLHLFLADGTLLWTAVYRDLEIDGDIASLGAVVGTPDGWVGRASAYFQSTSDGNDTALPPVSRSRLYILDEGGQATPSGYTTRHEPEGQFSDVFWVQPPFSYAPMAVLDGLGRMHRVWTPDYDIEVTDLTGRLLHTVRNEIERMPVTRDDLDAWRERRACPPQSFECDDSRTELALSMDIPDFKPVVGRMVAFPSGHIAVMRAWTDPEPDEGPIMGEYDMFDPDGHFLGRLPMGLSPRWFDGERLLATVWDDLGVASMVRYRVVDQP